METAAYNYSDKTSATQIYHVRNERMAGFVPSWDAPLQANESQRFSDVLSSYAPQPESPDIIPVPEEKKFGFLDIIDMVNPLQHVPVINIAYRALTQDDIRPISKIIGGGIFGGPAGVASGLVDAVLQEETGKDMVGNAVSFAGFGEHGSQRTDYDLSQEINAYEDLSASLLLFAQTPLPEASNEVGHAQKNDYDRVELAQGRTAGTIAVYS